MSAIAGLISWCGEPAGEAVEAAVASLFPRGRDGQGFWDGGSVALGWRQTVLHEEDRFDRQPVAGTSGLRLVFDGRIDNRAELGRTLGIPAGRARDWPDSAWALAAFEKWGADSPGKLLGDFAFAVWNERTRELFLARDHAGNKPLHFHRGDRFVMFASQPSALFTNRRVPRDIDDENLLRYLTFVRLPPGATLYRGIERVPIGTGLLMSERSTLTVRHWEPASLPALRYRRDDDYVEEYRSLLDDAVECRTRSIHPIGSHLSSGWDSSTVTATAARLLGNRGGTLTAFTSVPPAQWSPGPPVKGVIPDEGAIASAAARQYPNVEHVLIRGSGRLDLSALDLLSGAAEMPQRTVNNVGWLERLNREARGRGIRVMLAGAMGNRTLSYDGMGLLPRLLRHGAVWGLAREWRALHSRGRTYLELGARTFGPYLPDPVWDLLLRIARRPQWMDGVLTGLNPSAVSEELRAEIARSLRPANTNCRDDRAARGFATETPDVAWIWGGTLAAYDVETREPLADRRLMAFRAAVPERQFLSNGRRKWLVRRVMAGRLPEALTSQTGRGRQAADWFEAACASRDSLREEVERLASNARISGLLDIPVMRQLTGAMGTPGANRIPGLERILFSISGARFARRFLEAGVGERP